MELNPVEKWFVNSPFRRSMRERSVKRLSGRLVGVPPNPRVLEIGCGEGAAIPSILDSLKPGSMDAFDLDERQLERARKRLGKQLNRLSISTGSATAIPAAPATYDAVFQFQVFHHIPNWRTALAEVNRILKPGGYFVFTDTPIEFFRRAPFGLILRAVTEHPYDLMFSEDEYRQVLQGLKFEIRHWERLRSGSFEAIARKPLTNAPTA